MAERIYGREELAETLGSRFKAVLGDVYKRQVLYEMPYCMYQMTKRRRHKSKLQLAHNSWPTHAHHLLCKRISAAMQAHNSCYATGDTN